MIKKEPTPATLDDFANAYDKCHTGRKARTLPIEVVTEWAEKSGLWRYDEEQDLFFLIEVPK